MGVDAGGRGCNCFNHKRSVTVHNVKAVAPYMVLSDEGRRKPDAEIAGYVAGRVVVAVDVVVEIGGGLHEGYIRARDEARKLLNDGVL